VSEQLYRQCWAILVQHAGARAEDIDQFLQACEQIQDRSSGDCLEYRFCGVLGFGGKFWRYQNRLYITCYPEDETEKRRGVIQKVNQLLEAIRAESTKISEEGVSGGTEEWPLV
jgi:hypothetical protein